METRPNISKSAHQADVDDSGIAVACSGALLAFEVPSFGEVIYAVRQRRGQAQISIAAASSLSAGYYSELENCKRLAPPRGTALRIAQALQMNDLEAVQLASLQALRINP